ncbi:unnamed protein product [Amoebophrya sp. A120]|nr:unnamed protein product [Amoebophrya sp. A120]|eukprot:GSA120T00012422001.1
MAATALSTGAGAPAATASSTTDKEIHYIPYRGEDDLSELIALIEKDLSEPYSVFTYRFFVNNWPELCFLAVVLNEENEKTTDGEIDTNTTNPDPSSSTATTPKVNATTSTSLEEKLQSRQHTQIVGGIVCKLEEHKSHWFPSLRGYIGMIAVDTNFRRKGIAKTLVQLSLNKMEERGAHECILETELTNLGARKLYQDCGFVKHKRLPAYYLNGVDAFRLKYAFPPPEIRSQVQELLKAERGPGYVVADDSTTTTGAGGDEDTENQNQIETYNNAVEGGGAKNTRTGNNRRRR